MARPKKDKSEVNKGIMPIDTVSKNPADYLDYGSALIQYGMVEHEISLSKKKSMVDGEIVLESEETQMAAFYGEAPAIDLSIEQVQYLNMRSVGLSTFAACTLLGLSMAQPLLWDKQEPAGSTYKHCIDAIKEMQTILAEDVIWEKAIYNRNDLMLMFGVKSRRPEYRDNQPVAVERERTFRVMLSTGEYAVDENPKPVIIDMVEVRKELGE